MIVDKLPAHPELRRDSTDPEVRVLQERLNADGASPSLPVSGVFDQATEGALQAFQERHGLAATGVAELRTWGLLDELARRSITGPRATLGDVVPVSPDEHAAGEAILRGPGGGGVGLAMTGTGPGGAYEKEMFDALNVPLGDPLAEHGTTMEHADRIGVAAQEATERVFGAAITLASRNPADGWHPGSCKQGLLEAGTRQLNDDEIRGWADYLMDNPSYSGAMVNDFHRYDNSRPGDRAEHDRVRDAWLASGGRQRVIDVVRSWPAEAGTGTVYLELRHANYQGRLGMWRLFATLLHEFQHLVTHPNYDEAADAIGGVGRAILVEGMAEYMRFTVWTEVLKGLAADEALRKTVEGAFFDSHASADDYREEGPVDEAARADVYDEAVAAEKIVGQVGDANVHAAFFMGHVEALGIGESSQSQTSLAGLGSWRPGGNGEPDVYVVGAGGETVGTVRQRTGSEAITEEEGGMALADADSLIPAGRRLKVPGIRWHTAIAQDTRGQVANQNGVTQAELERANGLPHAPASTAVAAGTLLLIPVA